MNDRTTFGMKVFGGTLAAGPVDRKRLGIERYNQQIRAIVAAPSQAKAAAAFGTSIGFIRNYCSTTGNPQELDAASRVPPGTVLMRALDDHRGEYVERLP